MITKITELLKKPISLFDKRREVVDRIDEMNEIKEALRNGMNNIYIATCSDTSSSFNNTTFLNVSPEFRKEVSDYLNNRLVELAKEVQLLQGVAPIEYKENEEK